MPEPEYAEWLARVTSTYESVTFTCRHRLGDDRLARQVGVGVVLGLLARPTVFQHYGLPYSGRIAHLAEELISAARRDALEPVVEWPELLARLGAIPREHQSVFVLACVHGYRDDEIAAELGLPPDAARRRRQAAVELVRSIAADE